MFTTPTPDSRELKVLGLIGSGHLLSHVHILLLPPLFPLLKEEFGVSYTELGVVVGAFSVGGVATPIIFGWILDNLGARWMFWLIALFMLASILTVGRLGRAPAPAASEQPNSSREK